MPIHKRRFEAIDENGVTPETNAERLVAFLLENQDYAYRQTELEAETGIKRGSIGPTLTRLKERGIVDHRANYWRIADSYLASHEAGVYTSQTAAEYDDGKHFDVANWAASAEDETAHKHTEKER